MQVISEESPEPGAGIGGLKGKDAPPLRERRVWGVADINTDGEN